MPASAVQLMAVPLPLWRQLHALADAAVPAVEAVWATAFAALRRALTRQRIRQALDSHGPFALEGLWRAQWARTVDRPLRAQLPLLFLPLVEAGAAASLPQLRRLAGVPVVVTPGLAATDLALAAYVGDQLRRIAQTSLLARRQAVRWSQGQGWGVGRQAAWLRLVVGLTPRQVQHLERLLVPPPVQTMARTPRLGVVTIRQAAALGQTARIRAIARTQTMAAVNLGGQVALDQAVRQQPRLVETVRRYWVVTPPDVCSRCLAIAATHPGGVAVSQPFVVGGEAMMVPPAHVNCKCVAAVRAVRR